MVGEFCSHRFDLAVEVVSLLCGADSAITIVDFARLQAFDEFISSLATGRDDEVEGPIIGPSPYGFVIAPIELLGVSESGEHSMRLPMPMTQWDIILFEIVRIATLIRH